MTQRAITFKFVLPELLAVALGILVLIAIVYLTDKYPIPIKHSDASRTTVPERPDQSKSK
jgi:hypothetical protein